MGFAHCDQYGLETPVAPYPPALVCSVCCSLSKYGMSLCGKETHGLSRISQKLKQKRESGEMAEIFVMRQGGENALALLKESGRVMPINRQDKKERDLESQLGLCLRKW